MSIFDETAKLISNPWGALTGGDAAGGGELTGNDPSGIHSQITQETCGVLGGTWNAATNQCEGLGGPKVQPPSTIFPTNPPPHTGGFQVPGGIGSGFGPAHGLGGGDQGASTVQTPDSGVQSLGTLGPAPSYGASGQTVASPTQAASVSSGAAPNYAGATDPQACRLIGGTWNTAEGRCDGGGPSPPPIGDNPYKQYTNQADCFLNGGYWNGTSCGPPQGSPSTPSCPDGQQWNAGTNSCIPARGGVQGVNPPPPATICGTGYYLASVNGGPEECIPIPTCPAGTSWDGSTCATNGTQGTCPDGSPKDARGYCPCPNGQTWDAASNSCKSNVPPPPPPPPPPGQCGQNQVPDGQGGCKCAPGYATIPGDPSGACVKTGGGGGSTCSTNADCRTGQTCVNGQCVTPGGGATCSTNSDCPTGQVCTNGKCAPSGPGVISTPCPAGETMINGVCQRPSGGGGGGSTGQSTGGPVQFGPLTYPMWTFQSLAPPGNEVFGGLPDTYGTGNGVSGDMLTQHYSNPTKADGTLTCPQGQYWDNFSNSCLTKPPACGPGQVWNQQAQACLDVGFQSGPVSIPGAGQTPGQGWFLNQGPQTTSSGASVFACPAGQVWDSLSNGCIPASTAGQTGYGGPTWTGPPGIQPPPGQKYKCVNGNCVADPSGSFTEATCGGTCGCGAGQAKNGNGQCVNNTCPSPDQDWDPSLNNGNGGCKCHDPNSRYDSVTNSCKPIGGGGGGGGNPPPPPVATTGGGTSSGGGGTTTGSGSGSTDHTGQFFDRTTQTWIPATGGNAVGATPGSVPMCASGYHFAVEQGECLPDSNNTGGSGSQTSGPPGAQNPPPPPPAPPPSVTPVNPPPPTPTGGRGNPPPPAPTPPPLVVPPPPQINPPPPAPHTCPPGEAWSVYLGACAKSNVPPGPAPTPKPSPTPPPNLVPSPTCTGGRLLNTATNQCVCPTGTKWSSYLSKCV